MSKLELITSRIVAGNPWTNIVLEEFQFPSGNLGEYLIVEKEMAIMIIVLHFINDRYYTYLVEQYRYPINEKIWQFPMGTNEDATDIELHAKQELKEETGLVVGNLNKVGEYYVDPGLSRQKCSVFITEEVLSQGKQKLEESEEGMKVRRVSLQELNQMITDNKLNDSWGYVAIHYIHQYLNT